MKKFIPIIVIGLLIALAYFLGIDKYLTFDQLKEQRENLINIVDNHSIIAPVGFMLIYALSTALSIPGGIYLSVFGGFLFPQPFSTIYVVCGATTGAIIIFLAAKTAFGNLLKEKAGDKLQKMQTGFQENAVSYLLFLRFVPLFPFWLVNIAPAFFNVRLSTFALTTFFGIMPGAFAFTQAGTGLGSILDSGETFSIEAVFNNDMKIALVALGVVALIPVIVKKFRKKDKKKMD